MATLLVNEVVACPASAFAALRRTITIRNGKIIFRAPR
jgi:hypothetical protein